MTTSESRSAECTFSDDLFRSIATSSYQIDGSYKRGRNDGIFKEVGGA